MLFDNFRPANRMAIHSCDVRRWNVRRRSGETTLCGFLDFGKSMDQIRNDCVHIGKLEMLSDFVLEFKLCQSPRTIDAAFAAVFQKPVIVSRLIA